MPVPGTVVVRMSDVFSSSNKMICCYFVCLYRCVVAEIRAWHIVDSVIETKAINEKSVRSLVSGCIEASQGGGRVIALPEPSDIVCSTMASILNNFSGDSTTAPTVSYLETVINAKPLLPVLFNPITPPR